jgi:RNA recognition motif-containing protein
MQSAFDPSASTNSNNNSAAQHQQSSGQQIDSEGQQVTQLSNLIQDQTPRIEGKLFVGQVPKSIQEDVLHSIFNGCGTINEIKIIRDRTTGEHRGTFDCKYSVEMFDDKPSVWCGVHVMCGGCYIVG